MFCLSIPMIAVLKDKISVHSRACVLICNSLYYWSSLSNLSQTTVSSTISLLKFSEGSKPKSNLTNQTQKQFRLNDEF